MFWFYVIIHATINEKNQELMYSLKKNTMWIATILGFLVLVFGFLFLFAFPFFSITALQGTNKTANVFFTYPVVCFPLIIAKGVPASFPVKRTKQLGSSSRKWDLDSALPVCSKTQDFHQITGQKDHPIFQILALKQKEQFPVHCQDNKPIQRFGPCPPSQAEFSCHRLVCSDTKACSGKYPIINTSDTKLWKK